MDFVVQIISLVKALKEKRESIISNQIGRSGTSIGANIHESKYAHGTADFIAKMQIASINTVKTNNEPIFIGSRSLSVFVRYFQQIVCGNPEIVAECYDIVHTWLIFAALNVGDFPLGHVDGFSKLRLIQIHVFPKITYLFTKG